MTSPEAKKAFDIHAEPDKLRDEYGRNTLGQSCLMARRLVEAGVRCVTIDHSNWDTHDDNFATLKRELLPVPRRRPVRRCSATWPTAACSTRRWWWSPASSAGRRASTRTPAAITGARRSRWRWAAAASRAAGSSASPNARAERPAADPYGPEDLSATHLSPHGHRSEGGVPSRPKAGRSTIVNNGRVMRRAAVESSLATRTDRLRSPQNTVKSDVRPYDRITQLDCESSSGRIIADMGDIHTNDPAGPSKMDGVAERFHPDRSKTRGRSCSRSLPGVQPMRRSTRVVSSMCFLLPAFARANPPVASYIFPAGGQRGTTVEVRVGGSISHDAAASRCSAPASRRASRSNAPKTIWFEGPLLPLPDSQQEEDYRKDMAGKVTHRRRRAARGAAVAAAGRRRAPRRRCKFMVGDLPEIVEQEIDGDPVPVEVKLPVTVNGRIFPREDVDVWTVELKKGQTIYLRGPRRPPRLAAGRSLEVLDPQGRRLAENDEPSAADPFVRFTAAGRRQIPGAHPRRQLPRRAGVSSIG